MVHVHVGFDFFLYFLFVALKKEKILFNCQSTLFMVMRIENHIDVMNIVPMFSAVRPRSS